MRGFLGISLLMLAAWSQLAAGDWIPTAYEPHARMASGSQLAVERAAAVLRKMFRLRYSGGSGFAICYAVPGTPAALQTRGKRRTLRLDGSAPLWYERTGNAALLYGGIIAAGCDLYPKNPDYLPRWLVRAFLAKTARADTSEKVISGNHCSYLLSALLDRTAPPPFAAVMDQDPDQLTGVELWWYDQLALLLCETLHANKLLQSYVCACAEAGETAARAELVRRLTARARQKDFAAAAAAAARRWLWNDLFPRPAIITLARLSVLRRGVEFPKLDENGNPTAEKVSVPLAGLAGFLKERPDAVMLRHQLGGEIRKLVADESGQVKLQAQRVIDAISRLGGEEEAALRFAAEVDALERLLQHRQDVADFLARVERQQTPLRRFCRFELAERRQPSPLFPAVEAFLERAESSQY